MVAAVHRGHHLGGGQCAPLSEQRSHFKGKDAAALGFRHKSAQAVKIELPGAAAVAVNIHQLHGGAFAAGQGVQRRGHQRHQQGVHAVGDGTVQIGPHQLPMFRAEHFDPVPIGQAVVVEPLGKTQLAGGQLAGQAGEHGGLGAAGPIRRFQRNLDPMLPGGQRGGVHLKPEGVPLAIHRVDAPVRAGQQRVGKKPGPAAQHIVVGIRQAGGAAGHMLHLVQGDVILVSGGNAGQQTVVPHGQAVRAVPGQLETEPLVAPHPCGMVIGSGLLI